MKKAYLTLIAGAIITFAPLPTPIRLIGAATIIAAVIVIMYLTMKR